MEYINLGDSAKDRVTGVEGIVVGRTSWLTGCDRIGLQRPADKDGKVPDVWWADVTTCERVKANEALVGEEESPAPGGPQPDPQR